ncbi:MAG: DUF1223 domain-containing protein [Terriglobales bacterium]
MPCLLFLENASGGAQLLQGTNAADATTTASAEAHPVLVELFTSEGCSSCPPADALLEKMDAYQPIAGAQLIVLSEHVDYWDHDGWKDPNSSSALTERQKSYEAVLRVNEPYTPQFIVDGSVELRQGDPQRVDNALKKAQAAAKIPVYIDELNVDAANPAVLRAHVRTGDNFDKHGANVYVALALDRVESQVLHGENGGRHLVHVAVVREITRVGKLPKGESFNQEVQLKLKPGEYPRNLRVIAFIQEDGPGAVLGAALRKPASKIENK